MFFALSASRVQTKSPPTSSTLSTEIKSESILTSNRENALQVDPQLMEDLVMGINEGNAAEIIKESGILEEANVSLELSITPKNSQSIDKSTYQIEGSQVSSLRSPIKACSQLCDPCPSKPSVACWVRHVCGEPLNT